MSEEQKLIGQLIMALKVIAIWAENGSTEKDFYDIARQANKTLERVKGLGYD